MMQKEKNDFTAQAGHPATAIYNRWKNTFIK